MNHKIIITPELFGRKMKKIKEYEHHVLYIDEKTNIRESFQYFDLTHLTEETQIIKQNPKTNIKNDNRLSSLIDLVTENGD